MTNDHIIIIRDVIKAHIGVISIMIHTSGASAQINQLLVLVIMLAHHAIVTVISGVISSVIGGAINGGSRVITRVISRVIRGGGAHAGVTNHLIREYI